MENSSGDGFDHLKSGERGVLRAVFFLEKQDDAVRMSRVAEGMGYGLVSGPITKWVDALSEAGLVVRHGGGRYRRKYFLSLTDRGRAIAKNMVGQGAGGYAKGQERSGHSYPALDDPGCADPTPKIGMLVTDAECARLFGAARFEDFRGKEYLDNAMPVREVRGVAGGGSSCDGSAGGSSSGYRLGTGAGRKMRVSGAP